MSGKRQRWLEIVMIESAVYVVMKNELADILSGTLSMYERQSTYSPNLSVRFLIYLAQEYQRMLNINYGHNKLLMEKCRILEEYSKLVAVMRERMLTEKETQTALNQAVDYCTANGIWKETY